jgi:hypothetical protein
LSYQHELDWKGKSHGIDPSQQSKTISWKIPL